jgi:hypothetical protein
LGLLEDRKILACERPKKLGLWKVEEVGLVESRKSWACERPKNLGLQKPEEFGLVKGRRRWACERPKKERDIIINAHRSSCKVYFSYFYET